MDQIRTLHETSGTAIGTVLLPTFDIVKPLLIANQAAILTPTTESYGSHPRQKLDIYLSDNEPSHTVSTPILIFLYGGGLVGGDKQIPLIPSGLVYRNLGTFFAARGITTLIPDYRRVNSPQGGEDAVFPSGGEDLALVFRWLQSSDLVHGRKREAFVMGHSAGGLHLSTFLLEPRFRELRRALAAGEQGLSWKGAVNLGVPFHFRMADPERSAMLKAYYGSKQDVEERCAYGLLQALQQKAISQTEADLPPVLVLLGQFEPEDEIAGPTKDFVALWRKIWPENLQYEVIKGHNHISPTAFLMTGDREGEEWAEDVTKWIKRPST